MLDAGGKSVEEMGDLGREFLEGQVERSMERYEKAATDFRHALSVLNHAKVDIDTFQAALAAYTRNSDNPYVPVPIADVTVTQRIRRAVRESTEEKPTLFVFDSQVSSLRLSSSQEKEKTHKGKAWDFSWTTKAGIIRNMFKEMGEATYEEVLEALKVKNLSVPIDRGDLRRAVPKMLHRGEVKLVGKGRYKYLNVTD